MPPHSTESHDRNIHVEKINSSILLHRIFSFGLINALKQEKYLGYRAEKFIELCINVGSPIGQQLYRNQGGPK